TFGGVLAVKSASAEDAVHEDFRALNAERAIAARRDQIGSEVVRSLGYGTGEVSIGIVLLIVAASFRRGNLSVGDIGLFASYVTGRVGAGKSTLLRALLGLVTRDSGTIRWNDSLVDDAATVLVPPRVAYLPQVPRLFSESLADTVLLGLPDRSLDEVFWLTCLD